MPKHVYPIIPIPEQGTVEYMVRVTSDGECHIRQYHWEYSHDRDDLWSDDEFLAKLP